MKKIQRSYNDSEVWLEQQMKSFWEWTRGNPLSLGQLLRFWSDPSRIVMLQQASFSDDWISILYQRVSYLIRNKTLLGTEDDKIHQAKTILATAAMLQQREVADITELIHLYNTRQALTEPAMLKDEYPIFFEGFTAIQSKATMEAHILCSGFNIDETDPAIDLIVINNKERDEMHTYKNTSLREFIEFYKSMKNIPAKSLLRVKYMGRTIFMSSSGNKTLAELEIAHRSFIHVIEVPLQPIDAPPKKDRNHATKKSNKKPARKKGGKKSKKKRSSNCNYETKTLEDHKVEHSKRLSYVLEEVEKTFKEIRQRLSNLSIKKSLPKDRSIPQKKNSGELKTEKNPSLEGVGGKGGKVVFPLLVGNEECLYQSSKKNKQNMRTLAVDLHGCSREDATEKLDDSLPGWVDTAMKGEYPFVIPVDVVCGGGNQVLPDVVETWIRRNRQVANRPKSFC